jgi:hypothetical protein
MLSGATLAKSSHRLSTGRLSFPPTLRRARARESIARFFSGRFAVDIDETLTLTAVSWLESFSRDSSISLSQPPQELFRRYGLIQKIPELANHPRLNEWIARAIISPTHHLDVPIMDGAFEVLTALMRKYGGRIDTYLTARKPHLKEVSQRWLKEKGFPDAPIEFSPVNVTHAERNYWKAKLLRQRRYLRGIIDDQVLLGDLVGVEYHGTIISIVSQNGALRTPRIIQHRHVRCSSWHKLGELAGV